MACSANPWAASRSLQAPASWKPYGTSKKPGRIVLKEARHGLLHDAGVRVVRQAVPDVERQQPAVGQDAAGLAERRRLLRDEHQPELTHQGIKRGRGEGQGDA